MTVLALRLAGPLQAWGASSRFVRRTTEPQPTKSGVIGLLAAALGRRRSDPIEDLLHLVFGVRSDQPGRLVRDFQTARTLDGSRSMPLSYRFYLADAAFLAVVEADEQTIVGLHDALHHPTFPLYLGRRSCPPAGQVTLGLREGTALDVLEAEPWHAAAWRQRRQKAPTVRLDIVVDADDGHETVQDAPISFDPRRRIHGLRRIRRSQICVPNPAYVERPSDDPHQPMAAVGGG